MSQLNKQGTESYSEKGGNFLRVVCMLSLMSMGYSILNTLMTYFGGVQKLHEQLEQNAQAVKNDMFNLIDEETMFSLDEMIRQTIEHFAEIQISNVIVLLLGILSVLMMLQLKKNGFILYILYTLLMPGISLYFLNVNVAVAGAVSIDLFFGIVFCILYGINLKTMTN